MKNYLLMTATVTPPTGETELTRIDPLLRLTDYLQAFKYYLSDEITAIDGIIFVDNSNHALEEIRLLAQNYQGPKQIEILSFYGLDYPIEYNRGYGELKLIEYAYEHSHLMQAMQEADRFWKVTGRLKVMTLNKIITKAPAYFELCADFRMRRDQVDTRLIAFNIKGYKKYIYGRLHEMPGLIIVPRDPARTAASQTAGRRVRSGRARGSGDRCQAGNCLGEESPGCTEQDDG